MSATQTQMFREIQAVKKAWVVYGAQARIEAATARRRGEDRPATTSVNVIDDPAYSAVTHVVARPKRTPKAMRAVPYDEALARLLARRA